MSAPKMLTPEQKLEEEFQLAKRDGEWHRKVFDQEGNEYLFVHCSSDIIDALLSARSELADLREKHTRCNELNKHLEIKYAEFGWLKKNYGFLKAEVSRLKAAIPGEEEVEHEISIRSLATRVAADDDNLETDELDEGFRQGARWLRSRLTSQPEEKQG